MAPPCDSEGAAGQFRSEKSVALAVVLEIPDRRGLGRRLLQLFPGLAACGVGLALMVRAHLGLGPWDVLHQGLSVRTGLPIGTLVILVGLVVLLGWVPLRQRLGVGTVCNALLIGLVIDVVLAVVSEPHGLATRWAFLLSGLGLMGLGSGLYIGAGLGPGPRDGLMTGLAARGYSLRFVRTLIELSALAAGWALGGTVGVGTLVFALGIGPLVQMFLGRLTIPAPIPAE